MPSTKQSAAVVTVDTNQTLAQAATGRWGKVINELQLAEPYVLQKPDGGEIVIPPLTRRRRKKLKAAQQAYLMVGAQLAEIVRDQNADQGLVDRVQELMEESEQAYDQALFGDAFQEVYDLFEDEPEEYWDKMYNDVHDALVNRVPPPDGICPACHRPLDEDDAEAGSEPGKDGSSSTSSTDTGTPSTATSGPTSA